MVVGTVMYMAVTALPVTLYIFNIWDDESGVQVYRAAILAVRTAFLFALNVLLAVSVKRHVRESTATQVGSQRAIDKEVAKTIIIMNSCLIVTQLVPGFF